MRSLAVLFALYPLVSAYILRFARLLGTLIVLDVFVGLICLFVLKVCNRHNSGVTMLD